MDDAAFMRIERDGQNSSRHAVVRLLDPKFVIELEPDTAAPDKHGKGIIRRILIPNSWSGNYAQYGKHITAAQEFFARSFAQPEPKFMTKRLPD